MSPSPTLHPAEAADRHASLLGVAVLLLAAKFAVSASMHFVDESAAVVLDRTELALALGAAVLAVTILAWKAVRLSPEQRRSYLREDSFAFEAIRRARAASWNAMFLVLVVFEVVADDIRDVSADFYVQVALAVLLAVFGLKFFALMRDTGGDDDA